MFKNQRHETLAQLQSDTTIFNTDQCIKILEQSRWNCLEAVNYVLENVDSAKQSLDLNPPLIPNECLNELEGIRHFEQIFQNRHPNLPRWPVWFKSSLENAIHQSHGPFAIFLNHDGSAFAKTFASQILCSPSVLNILHHYKCILWPWDVTCPLNKQRLLEISGRARPILVQCLSHFININSYPLLLILSRQKDRIIFLDFVNGNSTLDQTRACLERTLNPDFERSIISINETTSLSPGWIGGRTAGNILRRPSFATTFRLSRPLRMVQRPHYISFYQPKESAPEVIVTLQEAKQWLNQTNANILTNHSSEDHQSNLSFNHTDLLSAKRIISPIPSLSLTNKDQYPMVHMSSRRAGWAPLLNR